MGANASIYNQPADVLAALLGGPGGSLNKPTYAATIALEAFNSVIQVDGVAATSATCTLTAGSRVGLLILILKDTGGVTYTLGTGFKSTGTVNPSTGKTIVVAFIGDGTNFIEFARSASAITY